MQDIFIKLTPQELMRMKGIVIDADAADALSFLSELLKRAEKTSQGCLKSHLDV